MRDPNTRQRINLYSVFGESSEIHHIPSKNPKVSVSCVLQNNVLEGDFRDLIATNHQGRRCANA